MSVSDSTRRTKIVCTLGPASSSQEVVDQLVASGMDCARLNFSHGEHSDHAARAAAVREAQRRAGRPLAIMADLQGPKLRVARSFAERLLTGGDRVFVCGDMSKNSSLPEAIPVAPAVIAEVLEPGDLVLLDDGLIRLRVVDKQADGSWCIVELGGMLKPGKGVCVPGTELPIPSLTKKDLDDLAFAVTLDIDYVALSFVRSPEDVYGLKMQLAQLGSDALVIAKIEQAQALPELDMIVEASDAVMVARGDLGVEIGAEGVPLEQKRIIACALAHGKAVITATQMLESMVAKPEPTRAEASDVANAVLDGSSAVMLSGETATGAYPVEAVSTMARIATKVETSLGYRHEPHPLDPEHGPVKTAITSGAAEIAEKLDAAAIVVPTTSGRTTSAVARHRPRRPIVGLSEFLRALQQMALEWGVVPIEIPHCDEVEELWSVALETLRRHGLAEPGERIVITAGSAMNVSGSTNLIRVDTV